MIELVFTLIRNFIRDGKKDEIAGNPNPDKI